MTNPNITFELSALEIIWKKIQIISTFVIKINTKNRKHMSLLSDRMFFLKLNEIKNTKRVLKYKKKLKSKIKIFISLEQVA